MGGKRRREEGEGVRFEARLLAVFQRRTLSRPLKFHQTPPIDMCRENQQQTSHAPQMREFPHLSLESQHTNILCTRECR